MKPFNHNIKFLRLRKGLSQRELGELLGVNRGNIATYEKESNAPDRVKQAIAEQFGLDLSKLITDEMNDENYLSFFITTKVPDLDVANEPGIQYGSPSLLSLIEQLPDSKLKDSIRAKAIQLIDADSIQKEKIITLHEYKDKLIELLKVRGYNPE